MDQACSQQTCEFTVDVPNWELLCGIWQLQSPKEVVQLLRNAHAGKITPEAQLLLVECLRKSHRLYQPERNYCSRLFRALVLAVEEDRVELEDELADLHAQNLIRRDIQFEAGVTTQTSADGWCYKTYAYNLEHPSALQSSGSSDPQQQLTTTQNLHGTTVHHLFGLITLKLAVNLFEGATGCHEWEAGFMLAEFVLSNAGLFRGQECLELGCGAGVVGVALSRVGAAVVHLTDGNAAAVDNCRHNLAINHCTSSPDNAMANSQVVEVTQMQWEEPCGLQPDIVLAADVLYDPGMQAEPAQDEAPGHVANALASELDSKTKKAPTVNQFPAEEVRRALGDRIQLTENQVQVWFSHKRRKDKKTQQNTGQAASTPPPANGPSSTAAASLPAAPVVSTFQAAITPAFMPGDGPAASVALAGNSAAAAATIPFNRPSASVPSPQSPSSITATPAVAAAAPSAQFVGTVQPGHSTHPQQGPLQLPASLQLPYSHLNGHAAIPGRPVPGEAHQISFRAPTMEQVVRCQPLPSVQTQPMFRAEPHSALQPNSLSQAARPGTQVPRQFLPPQYPPQSFQVAQQNARHAGANMSAFQPSLPVKASPARPAMTPMSVQAPTIAALAAAAAASAPAWSAARSSPHVSEHLPATLVGASHTPFVGTHGSQVEVMQEESDAGTEDGDTAPLRHGMHAEWRALVEYAKSTLPVAFRSDGPQLAFVFDELPSPSGADGNDPDGPAKRKRVMVDGYEMEEDGEDGMNFKKARLDLDQIRRPPSAGEGTARADAERRAYKQVEKAQMMAKRVEQTMAKDKERMEREKKRVKEKLEREKKKDEVAQEKAAEKLRQLQIREAKKAAERAEKGKRAEERKRLQDEKRREKELLRALAAQERQATRLRQRDVTGPKDDLDIEWEQLLEAHHQAGYGTLYSSTRDCSDSVLPVTDTAIGAEVLLQYGSGTEDQPDQGGSNLPERPEFPPPSLNLVPAFPADLPHKQGSDMLTVCAFLHSFTDLVGLPPVALDNLLAAVVTGEQSRLLADVHIALLRLLQMDLEDAHATGAIQASCAR
ncbi:hypothetical protein ABBQ38_009378 [Trebouxia sp. C0009 RCD-2024]